MMMLAVMITKDMVMTKIGTMRIILERRKGKKQEDLGFISCLPIVLIYS